MLGAGRDQLLNLILSNGLANRSFMAYNFPGQDMYRYTVLKSLMEKNPKKLDIFRLYG